METDIETGGREPMIKDLPQHIQSEKPLADVCLDEEVREHCQAILHGIDWPDLDSPNALRTLGITSCYAGEGVSAVAAQLAATAALESGGRVLLLDCNLPCPSVHQTFGVPSRPGLMECLRQGERLPEAIQPTVVRNLWVMATGELRGSPARAYDSPALPALLKDLEGDFDLVVCDMPTAARASCVTRVARHLDGVLLVVEAERVYCQVAKRAKELLLAAGASVLGVVLNKRRGSAPDWLDCNP
jgi:capsular exopolysaccharide synthesis family protein